MRRVSSSFLFPDPAVSRVRKELFLLRLLKKVQMQGGAPQAE
jgi:hypothetical protein